MIKIRINICINQLREILSMDTDFALSTTICTENSRKEFEELVHRYHKQAYNIAYRMSGNAADAEDLVQEAFIKAFKAFGSYRRELPFSNWMYLIIRNLYYDSLRRKPKFTLCSIDNNPDGEGSIDIPDVRSDPLNMVMSSEMGQHIQKALTSLSNDFRMAVILCDIEGYSYEEIGEIMGCSQGTVRSRIHRGRKQLQKLMKDYVFVND